MKHKQNINIFIIDDDIDICTLLDKELSSNGYSVQFFLDGQSALQALTKIKPNMCIIDLGLPDMDGLELVKELCQYDDMGLLILSGRGALPDKVLGLELGADHYITKPFNPSDITARIQCLTRRIGHNDTPYCPPQKKKAYFEDWIYNPGNLTLSNQDVEIVLSTAESNLLNVLLKSPQAIISRSKLLANQDIPYDRSIDSRLSRLRKKLEKDCHNPKIIKTVYGEGYILTCKVEWH